MTGLCRISRPVELSLLGVFLWALAGCEADREVPVEPGVSTQPQQTELARTERLAFPDGITEIHLSYEGETPEAEFKMPFSDELVPRPGDEVILEAVDSTGLRGKVGSARILQVEADVLHMRITTRPVPVFNDVRIQAHAVHRCDLLAASPLDVHAVMPGVEFEDIDVGAIGLCGQAVGKYPSTARFHFQLGRALDAHQQEKSSIAHYRRTLSLRPDYAVALLALGGKYINGEGVARDAEEGRRLLQQAHELGLPRAAFALARIHEQPSAGAGNDARLALAYYTTAALSGDLPAQLQLARIYEQGGVVEADLSRALDWYEKAATQGDAYSRQRLGQAYAGGEGRPQDWAKAQQWLDAAANQGVAESQVLLAQIYEAGHGLNEINLGKALYWYRQAAEQAYPMGQYHLGRMYALGLGVEKDREQARKWLLLAQAQGVREAARLLSNNEPDRPVPLAQEPPAIDKQVPKNLRSARRWLVKTQGYMDAECLEALIQELDDLKIQVVGRRADPDITLTVTMNSPEYYSGSFGPFRYSGYSIHFRAEAVRNSDNIRLFYSHGEEEGDDRSESCVDAVDEIADDLEDLID